MSFLFARSEDSMVHYNLSWPPVHPETWGLHCKDSNWLCPWKAANWGMTWYCFLSHWSGSLSLSYHVSAVHWWLTPAARAPLGVITIPISCHVLQSFTDSQDFPVSDQSEGMVNCNWAAWVRPSSSDPLGLVCPIPKLWGCLVAVFFSIETVLIFSDFHYSIFHWFWRRCAA